MGCNRGGGRREAEEELGNGNEAGEGPREGRNPRNKIPPIRHSSPCASGSSERVLPLAMNRDSGHLSIGGSYSQWLEEEVRAMQLRKVLEEELRQKGLREEEELRAKRRREKRERRKKQQREKKERAEKKRRHKKELREKEQQLRGLRQSASSSGGIG